MPDNLLRLPEVMKRVGLGRSAIYNRMSAGTFPSARSISPSCTRWLESEIDRWIESLPKITDQKAA